MYSIIDLKGKQYTVKEGDIVAVDLIHQDKDSKVEIDKVLLIKKDNEIIVGSPYINGAKVTATIIDHTRDKKVIVFKYKRRKNYKRMKGHKQPYTLIKIDKINLSD